LGEHLYAAAADFYARHKIHSNVLWDLSAVAWLLEPKWVTTDLRHAPRLMDQVTWSADGQRHLMRVARHIGRDGIFDDLCARLEAHASGKGAS
jgi:inosine-uridine nucleoside N-ribohydrolase